jgi:hypothetical protein
MGWASKGMLPLEGIAHRGTVSDRGSSPWAKIGVARILARRQELLCELPKLSTSEFLPRSQLGSRASEHISHHAGQIDLIMKRLPGAKAEG